MLILEISNVTSVCLGCPSVFERPSDQSSVMFHTIRGGGSQQWPHLYMTLSFWHSAGVRGQVSGSSLQLLLAVVLPPQLVVVATDNSVHVRHAHIPDFNCNSVQ